MSNAEELKKEIPDFIKRLETCKSDLAKTRDDLVEIKDELDMLMDGKEEEIADLESVIESLSRFV